MIGRPGFVPVPPDLASANYLGQFPIDPPPVEAPP
jgi:hypothetical protein